MSVSRLRGLQVPVLSTGSTGRTHATHESKAAGVEGDEALFGTEGGLSRMAWTPSVTSMATLPGAERQAPAA